MTAHYIRRLRRIFLCITVLLAVTLMIILLVPMLRTENKITAQSGIVDCRNIDALPEAALPLLIHSLLSVGLVAALGAIFVFMLGFYLARRERNHMLPLCLSMAAYSIRIISGVLYNVFCSSNLFSYFVSFQFDGNWLVRLIVICRLLGVYFLLEYFHANVRRYAHKAIIVFRVSFGVLLALIILLPMWAVWKYMLLAVIFTLVALCFILYLATRDFIQSGGHVPLRYVCAIILFVCGVVDIVQVHISGHSAIGYLGFLIFCFFIALDNLNDYMSIRYTLENLMGGLEQEVKKRTADLMEANNHLQAEIDAKQAAEHNLRMISTTDYLTGVYNRMQGQRCIDDLINMYNRYKQVFSLLLIDIDNFKGVNDHFGHDIGDKTLITMTRSILQILRNTDTLARWGGEEFMVIIPNCDLESAFYVAEKIRKYVSTVYFEGAQHITISIGVSQISPGDDSETVAKRADENLYKAKRAGKNCTYPKPKKT